MEYILVIIQSIDIFYIIYSWDTFVHVYYSLVTYISYLFLLGNKFWNDISFPIPHQLKHYKNITSYKKICFSLDTVIIHFTVIEFIFNMQIVYYAKCIFFSFLKEYASTEKNTLTLCCISNAIFNLSIIKEKEEQRLALILTVNL